MATSISGLSQRSMKLAKSAFWSKLLKNDQTLLKRTNLATVSSAHKTFWPDLLGKQIYTNASSKFSPQVLKMPALSPTMSEGTIVQWLKKEGDSISPGDVLCEIQTDKAVVSMDTEEEGILAKIIVPDNTSDIKIGSPIAVIAADGEDISEIQIPKEDMSQEATVEKIQVVGKDNASNDVAKTLQAHEASVSGPAVRQLLQKYNINASDINATGSHGQILKGDVLMFISSKNLVPVKQKRELVGPSPDMPISKISEKRPAKEKKMLEKPAVPVKAADYVDVELSSMRKTIAKRLTESKSNAPHAYCTISCNIDELLSARKALQTEGVKSSVNDFIVKAAALTLKRVPQLNVQVQPDGTFSQNSSIDISVAVAIESGLITPIVFQADGLTVPDISESVRVLATKAKEGKLGLQEFQGGSFTVSNLGMFGISEFTAIINAPQVSILAIGTAKKILKRTKTFETRMDVTLCYDARAVLEDDAGIFLETFKAFMESPSSLTRGVNADR